MKRIFLTSLVFLNLIISCFAQSDLSTIINKAEKAVCLIETFDASGNPLKLGTGFFIDSTGTCVSNYHVIDGASEIKVTTIDSLVYKVKEIVKSSDFYDLVIFKLIIEKKTNFLTVNKKLPVKGENIITIGNPQGLDWSVSDGIISSIRTLRFGNILQITAPISEGNSGSPVLNRNGEVIGIATFMIKEGQNLNFALHISILDSITSNVAIFKSFNDKIVLPDSKEIALSYIDSLIELKWTTIKSKMVISDERILGYINDFQKKYPSSSEGYIRKGDFYNASWEIKKAFESYNKAIKVEPNNPHSYLKRAIFIVSRLVYFDSTKNEKIQLAISDYTNYGNFSKENLLESYKKIADCYAIMDNYQKAIDFYSKFIDTKIKEGKPVDAAIYVDRGYQYSYLKNYQKAYDDLEKSVQLQPTCINKKWLRSFLFDNEKYEEASPYYSDECLAYYSDYYEKSFVLYKIGGDMEKAKTFIEFALKELTENRADEDFAEDERGTLENYLRLSATLDGLTESPIDALKNLNRILRINPRMKDDLDFCRWMMETKIDAEDYIGALKDVNLLIEKHPKEGNLFFQKCRVLFLLNDNIGCIKACNKAIELEPKKGNYYLLRGWAKYYNDDKAGGCADWSKAGEMGEYKAYENIQKHCQ